MTTMAAAGKIIGLALRKAARIKTLLTRMGQGDEDKSLNKRYREVMKQPIDFSLGRKEADDRGRLMVGVSELMRKLQKGFLHGPP
jgi:hypothetical protein